MQFDHITVSSHKIFNYYIFNPKIWIKMCKNFTLKIIWSQREKKKKRNFVTPFIPSSTFCFIFQQRKDCIRKNLPSGTYWNIIFIPPKLTEISNLGRRFSLNSFSSVDCMQFYNGNMCVVHVIVIMSQFLNSKQFDSFIKLHHKKIIKNKND